VVDNLGGPAEQGLALLGLGAAILLGRGHLRRI
jgi:hypothetical protein